MLHDQSHLGDLNIYTNSKLNRSENVSHLGPPSHEAVAEVAVAGGDLNLDLNSKLNQSEDVSYLGPPSHEAIAEIAVDVNVVDPAAALELGDIALRGKGDGTNSHTHSDAIRDA